ncbi:50S ribosomal protein L18 [Patescibacteria group bacterium]|nr:50S ribosomal protein L18 [Patescibacteria group bacterium]
MINKLTITKRDRIKRKIKGASSKNAFKSSIRVYKSNIYNHAFLCDEHGKILKGFCSKNLKGSKVQTAHELGTILGDYIVKNKIENLYFNRSGFRYMGRIKAIAEGLREKGVKI